VLPPLTSGHLRRAEAESAFPAAAVLWQALGDGAVGIPRAGARFGSSDAGASAVWRDEVVFLLQAGGRVSLGRRIGLGDLQKIAEILSAVGLCGRLDWGR
jgi:hypothetical protein